MENETPGQGSGNWCDFRCNMTKHVCHGSGGAIYGLGFLGALVYYVTTATSLLAGIIGVLKAIFWPAFLVYGLLKFLGM